MYATIFRGLLSPEVMFCAVPQGFQGPMLPASLGRAEPPSREVLCYLITFGKTYQAKFSICMLQAFSHFQNG